MSISEPANLSEAFRDRTEALDALGRAVVAYADIKRSATRTEDAIGVNAREIAIEKYVAAHKTVQKFLNGDAGE